MTRDGSWCGERRYDASLAKLLQDMEEGNVCRACLVAIADYVDNEIIIESARAHPERFVPIAGLNPRSLPTLRRVEAVVAELAAQGFAGIKLHPRMNGYDPLDAKCIAVFDAAAEHGLVILLDTLFRRRGLATTNAPTRSTTSPTPARTRASCCCTPLARRCSTCSRSFAPTRT